ncbi:uncharacterized protein [Prorops nasuta]|uniref:uncharacterized protein isoform X1 n=1 Tax=Prorops nasuta TaxID=863751 RepID=UPI0034CEA063
MSLVLTKQQQRQSLSAKKSAVKGLKNVLALPQETYWPFVKTESCSKLKQVLTETLPVLKKSAKIPWLQLRKLNKEERIKIKKEALSKETHIVNKNVVTSVITGINAVTRAIEKNNICSVLLDAKVEPLLLVKHIIIMAQINKIPVLLIPILKNITVQTMEISTAALALKINVAKDENHHFYPLYKMIQNISKDFPIPKNLNKIIQNAGSSTNDNNDLLATIKETATLVENTNIPKESSFTLPKGVYKYRSSIHERAYTPPSTNIETHSYMKQDWSDFIPISKSDSDDDNNSVLNKASKFPLNKRYSNIDCSTLQNSSMSSTAKEAEEKCKEYMENQKMDITYLSLKVKRLQGNSKRVKATKIREKKKK